MTTAGTVLILFGFIFGPLIGMSFALPTRPWIVVFLGLGFAGMMLVTLGALIQ